MKKFILLSCLLSTGCMAAGTQVKEEQLSQFHTGRSTVHDVVGTLGDPNTNYLMPDGARMICYSYVQAQARPETFIPIIGGFVGGADSRSNSTCFIFTDAGILKSYT